VLEFLKERIWGKKLSCDDPVFGHLTTQRIKGRGRPVGDPPVFEWFGAPMHETRLRFARIEQVVVHAGRDGPSEEHRQVWLSLLENHAAFEGTVKTKCFENYLWHKEMLIQECREEYGDKDLSRCESWPRYVSADEAFASPCFDVCWLNVYGDRLEFYVFNDWDKEHNLKIWVRDGQFAEMAQE
jgi:hypothetical protein